MHITVTQDHATQVSRLYVDNLLACEFIGAVPTLTDPHLNFGSRYDASAVMSQYMVGVLDDFGIWYRVLTAAEIDALYEINTSAEEIAPSSRTVAYPNPTTGSVTIAGEYSSTAAAAVEVVDARGRVMPVVPRTNLSPRTLTLDLSGLPIGLYTLRCGGAVHRVMKQE
ncbi:MAG: T9SS type A sorting domain-containing protein [Flavobacteriales bacterium]|nr:T9SS type A sorting domain-containing protein [Flavobacteriales bacterium]